MTPKGIPGLGGNAGRGGDWGVDKGMPSGKGAWPRQGWFAA